MPKSDAPLREAHREILVLLLADIPEKDIATGPTSVEHLRWMIFKAIEKMHEWPIDKIARWTGYIQGVCAAHHHIDVPHERERTRPILHGAYYNMGILPPETTANDA